MLGRICGQGIVAKKGGEEAALFFNPWPNAVNTIANIRF